MCTLIRTLSSRQTLEDLRFHHAVTLGKDKLITRLNSKALQASIDLECEARQPGAIFCTTSLSMDQSRHTECDLHSNQPPIWSTPRRTMSLLSCQGSLLEPWGDEHKANTPHCETMATGSPPGPHRARKSGEYNGRPLARAPLRPKFKPSPVR